MQTPSSSYMLIFRGAWSENFQALSEEQKQQLLQKWTTWYDGLIAQGKVDHGRPLGQESRVVSGVLGERIVDGPFAESKEAIGGYFLLTVSELDEATEIARGCPSLPYGVTVEIRPVSDCCPSLGTIIKSSPAVEAVLVNR